MRKEIANYIELIVRIGINIQKGKKMGTAKYINNFISKGRFRID